MKTRRAFTLIELLIVITIIGILAVSFAPRLLGAPSQARDAKRVEDINTIAGILKIDDSPYINKTGGTFFYGCVTHLDFDLSDFGGTIPEDPNHEDQLLMYGISACDEGLGGYIVIDLSAVEPIFEDANSEAYRFVVASSTENIENANTNCSQQSILFATGFEEPTEGFAHGNCYVQYVQ